MDKFINYIFNEKKDINDIFESVLKKELKKYILMICKNEQYEVSSCNNLLQEKKKNVK